MLRYTLEVEVCQKQGKRVGYEITVVDCTLCTITKQLFKRFGCEDRISNKLQLGDQKV